MSEKRVPITQLTEEEALAMRTFIAGESCRIPANTPHFIVSQGRRVAGVVAGKNWRGCTRCYSHDIVYRQHSDTSVIAYYC